MPVRQVLAIHTSRELSEWMAYEKAFGPIDNEWRDETLAEIQELLQHLIHVEANAHTGGKSSETRPKSIVRPGELWKHFKGQRSDN